MGNDWGLDGDELDIHMGVYIYGDRPIWVFEMEQVNLS